MSAPIDEAAGSHRIDLPCFVTIALPLERKLPSSVTYPSHTSGKTAAAAAIRVWRCGHEKECDELPVMTSSTILSCGLTINSWFCSMT